MEHISVLKAKRDSLAAMYQGTGREDFRIELEEVLKKIEIYNKQKEEKDGKLPQE